MPKIHKCDQRFTNAIAYFLGLGMTLLSFDEVDSAEHMLFF